MAAGLDSLGAVELRGALRERLGGLQLPPTLLYDYQTVEAITRFISEDLAGSSPAAAAGAPSGPSGGVSGGGAAGISRRPGTGSMPVDLGPSSLLKLLRGAPAPRPLFLAAPGVANAQSAYVSWGKQPEYTAEGLHYLVCSTGHWCC